MELEAGDTAGKAFTQEPASYSGDLVWEARKQQSNRLGFITGLDLFTSEEIETRQRRAQRFNVMPALDAASAPVVSTEALAARKALADKLATRNKAAELQQPGMMDIDLLESRNEAGEGSTCRDDTLHVYGVDLLSTADIMKYFRQYCPRFVEWINDSSCNVCFADGGTVKRVLAGMGKPLREDQEGTSDESKNDGARQQLDVLHRAMGKAWHKGQDLLKGGTPVPLLFRVASSTDMRPSVRPVSRYLWKAGTGSNTRRRERGLKRRMGDTAMSEAAVEGKQARISGDLKTMGTNPT